jgi:hypothetical protein
MKSPIVYILDSDVLIAAKNTYYAFDICPGFWSSIMQAHRDGRAHSVDRIKMEILAGHPSEDLVKWVRSTLPAEFFRSTSATDILDAYAEVALWVQRSPQYLDRAKAKFATEADGWLVAFSRVFNTTVVTNEQPRPDARNRVPLPDICAQFNVSCSSTFAMLRDLGVTLHTKST